LSNTQMQAKIIFELLGGIVAHLINKTSLISSLHAG
jgi:hypothetical protein